MSTGTAATNADPAVRPFHVDIAEEAIVDLRRRIAAWRPPEREPVDDQSQGVQLATVQDLANYWATEYDWRRCQAKLNTLEHFITSIDGLDVHFIHVRSPQQNALPLVVSHGWPGSIIEQLKIIEPLTNPTDHGGSASDVTVNSGGALADSRARVVGINTAVAGVGLGLAVPINDTTRRIVSALMHDGRVRRAYLGIAVAPAPVAPVWRSRLGGRSTGLRVASVVAGGPGDRAGLRTGDLLLTADGHEVATAQDLQRLMFTDAIGRRLGITVMRNGALVDVIAEPSELVGA